MSQTAKQMCGRCYDEVDRLFYPPCNEKPELLVGRPMGQYHCPDCGAMVLAGVAHPWLCLTCLHKSTAGIDL